MPDLCPSWEVVIKNFEKAKAKSHSSEALLEILERQITGGRHTCRRGPGQHGWAWLLVGPCVCSESLEKKPGAEQLWNKLRVYLLLITEFYLNNHYSMIIGKCHWKVLYKE